MRDIPEPVYFVKSDVEFFRSSICNRSKPYPVHPLNNIQEHLSRDYVYASHNKSRARTKATIPHHRLLYRRYCMGASVSPFRWISSSSSAVEDVASLTLAIATSGVLGSTISPSLSVFVSSLSIVSRSQVRWRVRLGARAGEEQARSQESGWNGL